MIAQSSCLPHYKALYWLTDSNLINHMTSDSLYYNKCSTSTLNNYWEGSTNPSHYTYIYIIANMFYHKYYYSFIITIICYIITSMIKLFLNYELIMLSLAYFTLYKIKTQCEYQKLFPLNWNFINWIEVGWSSHWVIPVNLLLQIVCISW